MSLDLDGSGQEMYLGLNYGQEGGDSAKFLIGKELAGAAVGLRGQGFGFSDDIFAGAPVYYPPGYPVDDLVAGFTNNGQF